MRNLNRHTEWLSLIEVSGPFLTLTMLEQAFPQGLESVETPRRQHLRAAYDEWYEAVDENDPQLLELHKQWVRLVLTEILEYDDLTLFSNIGLKKPYNLIPPTYNGTFIPDLVIQDQSNEKPRLFISVVPPGTDLESVKQNDGWPSSLAERMTILCRSNGVRLGLITNGDRWMLVNAPIGNTSSYASWYARLWFQEPITLKAFQSLLGVRRCFGPTENNLETLLEESLKYQDEVTDTLGEQVRRAVEVLIQCLDKADQDRNRELLHDVSPRELYEAGLTIMMRIVFILSAEERGLLLLGDPLYDQYYAISTLRGQLSEEAEQFGPEILDRRHDAWARLLAVFRVIYSGIEHETLRMPALGGSLFDPNRFPFLEGRPKGTDWYDTISTPLPIDNRTVLFLLNSLQVLEQRNGALLMSYRALDVEQIGHVYEGLLEHTVVRVPQITLGLIGSHKAKNPNISLSEMESARIEHESTLLTVLQESTQRSEAAIRNALARPVDDAAFSRIISVCGGDMVLANRVRPFSNLLRTDAWGDPIVYRANAFMVTLGADRRESGTHYTPKSLTESVVVQTLEPLVYLGPVEGKQREEWKLKKSSELLHLKICDIAMGSGAFLVQACRWLAERVVESWANEEANGKVVTIEGEVSENLNDSDPMPSQLDERLVIAKRLIAERCLYGIDANPLAVELAKLSIWLVTLAKGRPFGFLDHNFRHGDSLLGIYRLDQLKKMSMNPDVGDHQLRIFEDNIEMAVNEAIELRNKLREVSIRDIRDIELMERIDSEVRGKLKSICLIADALVGVVLECGGNKVKIERALDQLVSMAGEFLAGNSEVGVSIASTAREALVKSLPGGNLQKRPFHWPLEFPEVFVLRDGFDAVIGNPPFLWGNRISTFHGDKYLEWLLNMHNDTVGSADLCVHFFRRAHDLLSKGSMGLIATNSICQTVNRVSSLAPILEYGSKIYWSISDKPWPGIAGIHIAIVCIFKGSYKGLLVLDGKRVNGISSFLNENEHQPDPLVLPSQADKSFKGVITLGPGFVLDENEIEEIKRSNRESLNLIWPMLNGEDLLSHPEQKPSRMVINFTGMSLEEARQHPMLINVVEKRVLPDRQKVKELATRRNWWLYKRPCPNLYGAISKLEKVLVNCVVSKYICFAFLPKRIVFTNALNVFATDSYKDFAVLQSTLHEAWARYYGSTLETRNRYNPSDCFETFPFPSSLKEIGDIGLRYYEYRQFLMYTRQEGLTDIYNSFHNPKEVDEAIWKLRKLHIMLDQHVTAAYGWKDLDLDHGFHETKYGMRFTISESIRTEVLNRLLKLNYERYEQETKEVSNKKVGRPNKSRSTKKSETKKNEPDLFELMQES